MTKIAIVDDHILFRRGLSIIINSFSEYKIISEANTGKEFVNSLNPNNLPGIVLLDISMPEMNGYETARWLFTHYPGIKVLNKQTNNTQFDFTRMLFLFWIS